jgi:hypothetical protein
MYQFVITFLLFLCFHSVKAQVGVTLYNFRSIGLQTHQDHKISGEFRIFGNLLFEDIALQVNGFYNFKAQPFHQFSLGLGLQGVPFSPEFTGLRLPLQLSLFPFQQHKRFAMVFELAPFLVLDRFNTALLEVSWGIRYYFDREE